MSCDHMKYFAVFLGLNGECFADSKHRILPFLAANEHGLTIEICKKLCFEDHGYVYAGVQYSSQCFCGNNRPTTSPVPQSQCSMACSGDRSQKCGGSWRSNIYQNPGQSTLWEDCENGWKYSEDTGLCYRYFGDRKPWDEARSACESSAPDGATGE